MSREPVYRSMVVLGRLLFTGLRLRVRGLSQLPYDGGAVLAITHFSYLDFALTEWAVHRQTRRLTRFMATAKSFRHRLAGPLMRAMKHIPSGVTFGRVAGLSPRGGRPRRGAGSRFWSGVPALAVGEVVGLGCSQYLSNKPSKPTFSAPPSSNVTKQLKNVRFWGCFVTFDLTDKQNNLS